ncbi:MAG: MgtC/SapB family protein [Lachnospiraceae bacterium]
MLNFLYAVQDFNTTSILIRLFLSMIMGSLIGLERGSHGQPAGIRTFALVSLGAAMVTITGEYLVLYYHTGDPARLAAQVISGIGFLGVGTIIVTGKNFVKGLTTAASLWTTACLGIMIGSGYIIGSLLVFVLIFFVMTFLSYISHKVDANARGMLIYMEVDRESGVQAFFDFVEENDYRISSVEKQKRQPLQGKDAVLTAKLDLKKRKCHMDVIQEMQKRTAIHYVEEIR